MSLVAPRHPATVNLKISPKTTRCPWLTIDEMFALELATCRRWFPAQPIFSALQRSDASGGHLPQDLAATVDLPPHTALFSLQLMDLTHRWWSDREDNDIHIFDVLPLAAAACISHLAAFSGASRSGPFPRSTAAFAALLARRQPHNAPPLHTGWTVQQIVTEGVSHPGVSQLRAWDIHLRQLGLMSSSSASPCGVSSNLSSLNARSSHWFLPMCLLVVLEKLLTCTFVTSHSLWTRGPVTREDSAWFLSCAFWICLQVAGVRLR